MSLRPVAALHFPDIEAGGADMARPRYVEVDPTTLFVDETYQRNLSDRSRALIRRIIASWDWRAFKPPSVVAVDGGWHVIDGQHTAIAAASHPLVGNIPVQVIEAEDQAARATAFVRLNRDRIAVTPTQLHHSLLGAGDEDALTIRQVCERAGARILKAPPGDGYWQVGDTVSVSAVSALISRRHAIGARRVLEVLVQAKMAPLSLAAIKAVEALLFEPEYAGAFDVDDLATLLREHGSEIDRQAKVFAVEHRVSMWRGLTALLYRNVRKVRRGHRAEA